MQELSVAFGRVTRATIAANPELKTQVCDLLNRAYYNLHGTPISTAETQWVASITGAALQLCLDNRVASLSVRGLIQLFETVIRISEEHLHEARRHTAMASNVFYLKETSLDAVLSEVSSPALHPADTKVVGLNKAYTGRVDVKKPADPFI